MSGSE
jgi:hypothetical protein